MDLRSLKLRIIKSEKASGVRDVEARRRFNLLRKNGLAAGGPSLFRTGERIRGLVDVYRKSEVYSKSEVDALFQLIPQIYLDRKIYPAFSFNYDQDMFPILADHQALTDHGIMVSSGAEATHRGKGWLSKKAQHFKDIVLSKLTYADFSRTIGRPYTKWWNTHYKNNFDPDYDASEGKQPSMTPPNPIPSESGLKLLSQEKKVINDEIKHVLASNVEGKNMYDLLAEKLFKPAREKLGQLCTKEGITDFRFIKDETAWKTDLQKIGKLHQDPERWGKIYQSGGIIYQPSGGWIFSDIPGNPYNDKIKMTNQYVLAMQQTGSMFMIITEPFDLDKKSLPSNLKYETFKYKKTKNVPDCASKDAVQCEQLKHQGCIFNEDDGECVYTYVPPKFESAVLYDQNLCSVKAETEDDDRKPAADVFNITFTGDADVSKAPWGGKREITVCNFHGGSDSADYNITRLRELIYTLQYDVICGDSNITKSKTSKNQGINDVLSEMGFKDLKSGKNYSDKMIKKSRWMADGQADILLNNQVKKAGTSTEVDGMFIVFKNYLPDCDGKEKTECEKITGCKYEDEDDECLQKFRQQYEAIENDDELPYCALVPVR